MNVSSKNSQKTWDVIVVGGGPAGMIAAGRAAERGLKVLLLEKNQELGKKLLMSGGGRCNVTNSEFDNRVLLAKYKDAAKFLHSPFSQYDVQKTLDFFHSHNMPTKVENEKRTFPQSDKAASVLEVLEDHMKTHNVTIQTGAEVKEFTYKDGTITNITLKDGSVFSAKSYILATGGKSRPETGSTGDGFTWAKKLGHTIVEPSASLVPIASSDTWISELAGVSLPEAKISILVDGEKQKIAQNSNSMSAKSGAKSSKPIKGKVLFTHIGLSGPGILNLSKTIGELLECGDVDVSLDLTPTFDLGTLDKKLNELFRSELNKKLKNCLGLIDQNLPTALIKIIIDRSGVNGDTPAHSITRENRKLLVQTMKDFRIRVKGLLGTDKAIVTSGGVVLTEIDTTTMRSKICTNLFLIGDMLHVDRPSGGYSLQLCWTTGYVAGSNV